MIYQCHLPVTESYGSKTRNFGYKNESYGFKNKAYGYNMYAMKIKNKRSGNIRTRTFHLFML